MTRPTGTDSYYGHAIAGVEGVERNLLLKTIRLCEVMRCPSVVISAPAGRSFRRHSHCRRHGRAGWASWPLSLQLRLVSLARLQVRGGPWVVRPSSVVHDLPRRGGGAPGGHALWALSLFLARLRGRRLSSTGSPGRSRAGGDAAGQRSAPLRVKFGSWNEYIRPEHYLTST